MHNFMRSELGKGLIMAAGIAILSLSLLRFGIDGVALPMMGRSLSQGGDFAAYYVAALMARNGDNIYDYDPTAAVARSIGAVTQRYLYPPLLALLLRPMTYLPYRYAYKLWVLVNVVCLWLAVGILVRVLGFQSIIPFLLFAILVANMYVVYLAIDIGQINIVLLLIFTLVFACMKRRAFFLAGLLVGLGAMLKVTPILLVGLFLLQRRWTAIAGTIASVLILALVSYATVGSTVMMDFITRVLFGEIQHQIAIPANVSMSGFLYRVTSATGSGALLPFLHLAGLFLIGAVLVIVTWRRASVSSKGFDLMFGAWITAIPLVSPTTWEHNLVWLIPVLIVVAVVLANPGSAIRGQILWLSLASYGVIYALLAFENLPLNRAGQWQFQTGWWIFNGGYLRDSFIADVRLAAVVGLFVLTLGLATRFAVPMTNAERSERGLGEPLEKLSAFVGPEA